MLFRYMVSLVATLLMTGIAAHAWRRRSLGLSCLAAWCTTLATSSWLIALGVAPDGSRSELNRSLIILLITTAGPLLFSYAFHSLKGRLPGPWPFLPVALNLGGLLLFGTALNQWYGLYLSMYLEWCYTAASIALYLSAYWSSQPRRLPDPALGKVLAMVTTLHLSQGLSPLLGPDSPWPITAVFLVVAFWISGLVVVAVAESALFQRAFPEASASPSAEDLALFEQIEMVMRDARPWTDPDLELAGLAAQVGAHANAVSRALARGGSTTFYDYVNRHRVQETERLLLDPKESRYKVEALGRQAGFRSRSTFFKVFREHYGMSPAEFRRRRDPIVSVGAPTDAPPIEAPPR